MIHCVGVILIKHDGSVLIQHRDNKPTILNPNKWAIIGGGVEINSDKNLVSASIRELQEETDYRAEPKDLHFLSRDIYTTEKGFEVERTILWAHYDKTQKINCHEGQEIRFVSQKELSELNLASGHEFFLRKASEKIFYNNLERKG